MYILGYLCMSNCVLSLSIYTYMYVYEHRYGLVYPSLGIGAYGDKVTNGELTDPTTQAELVDYVASFAAFCREG